MRRREGRKGRDDGRQPPSETGRNNIRVTHRPDGYKQQQCSNHQNHIYLSHTLTHTSHTAEKCFFKIVVFLILLITNRTRKKKVGIINQKYVARLFKSFIATISKFCLQKLTKKK